MSTLTTETTRGDALLVGSLPFETAELAPAADSSHARRATAGPRQDGQEP